MLKNQGLLASTLKNVKKMLKHNHFTLIFRHLQTILLKFEKKIDKSNNMF